jgi:beta-galactosidase
MNALLKNLLALTVTSSLAQSAAWPAERERLSLDAGWRFAFESATNLDYATSFFSYLAKTGNGVGPAGPDFDDRGWRKLDLPHDWAVEVPFDARGSHSHGYKAIGKNFPETSVGWYRKTFFIPASDLGRRISVEFDGVFRDSRVWINGHYLGNEESGYTSFARNLTEFLNYGGENVLAVRVDATLEEGWFYEGAGIYRHVWLVKTAPLHVARYGTFATSEVKENSADVTARVTVVNEGPNAVTFDIENTIPDAATQTQRVSLAAGESREITGTLNVAKPTLWSLETPHLYKLATVIRVGDAVVDRYEMPFGIRSFRFDPNEGFFLNGKHVKLHGANNHQDHAGVGVAIPDALQEFRIARLKEMGCNIYRCSHNPPTPELLDACDRLGMVVIDENRLMGTADYHREHLREMMLRDRNHPSIVLWSLGNEEWRIEGNETGARITATMNRWAKEIDPTRPTTVAISGGWGGGSSTAIDVMGYNYISHGNTDQHHRQYPLQPGLGTEECAFTQTRGIYFDDRPNCHLRAYDWVPNDWGASLERGWTYYAERPYLAGMCVWTGFDYRGEPNPFGWPAISSQHGILDLCGFSKDGFYYCQAWWKDEPVLYVFPHWNWPGREGQEISVWAHSNCDEVELFLNGRSLGRKTMNKNSHLEWPVKYAPGTLFARGYKAGKEILSTKVETTGDPVSIRLVPDRPTIKADGADVSVIAVNVNDAPGRMVPTATNTITFEITGPGKIIGVGNGDPSSHEADRYVETVRALPLADWRPAFDNTNLPAQATVYRASFELPEKPGDATFLLALPNFGKQQSVELNGQPIAQGGAREINLASSALQAGKNVVAVVATQPPGKESGPGLVRMTMPPAPWKRSLFGGLAQVIVQSTGQPGEITLTATSPGLSPATLKLEAAAGR